MKSTEVSRTQREQRREEISKGERGQHPAREREFWKIISFLPELVTKYLLVFRCHPLNFIPPHIKPVDRKGGIISWILFLADHQRLKETASCSKSQSSSAEKQDRSACFSWWQNVSEESNKEMPCAAGGRAGAPVRTYGIPRLGLKHSCCGKEEILN